MNKPAIKPNNKTTVVTTDDILVMLCKSVTDVLANANANMVTYSALVQKITKTSLKPDIGSFVLFDGGFSGLVVINFSAAAAIEIYQSYMTNMGIPLSELSTQHTSDDVGNVMGELLNQILGDFTSLVGKELQTSITQSQPKMLTVNKQLIISIDTNLDRPQARRVTFTTQNGNIFYLELAMDRTEFIKLHDFVPEEFDPDEIIRGASEQAKTNQTDNKSGPDFDQDLLDELGI
ncbi:DUF3334 family protein [Catenovulum sp. 2E275]|uniref:DUF3334 family protein n=1 Tax=Catenovulum sp. 2E275 TaxID=2980497 RepID=UPI0021CFCFFE|nr:DUF3334 family protein [Catenovulum sp. 2E275]MCU4674837.1 DUF3334 family protein [Catenovulum sp. 2E275]